MTGAVCPVMDCPCLRDGCAWWLGSGCAVAYVGADCKRALTSWRGDGGSSIKASDSKEGRWPQR